MTQVLSGILLLSCILTQENDIFEKSLFIVADVRKSQWLIDSATGIQYNTITIITIHASISLIV